jgi:hypothetical protein
MMIASSCILFEHPGKNIVYSWVGEIRTCLKVPSEIRAFGTRSIYYVKAKEQVWPRAKEFAVGPFWSFLYGMFVFGFVFTHEVEQLRKRKDRKKAEPSASHSAAPPHR